jgi:hypothetical protein
MLPLLLLFPGLWRSPRMWGCRERPSTTLFTSSATASSSEYWKVLANRCCPGSQSRLCACIEGKREVTISPKGSFRIKEQDVLYVMRWTAKSTQPLTQSV